MPLGCWEVSFVFSLMEGGGGGAGRTGSWDMMDWNCAGFRRPESRRNSSSVRMVLQERFAAAGSMPIFFLGSV